MVTPSAGMDAMQKSFKKKKLNEFISSGKEELIAFRDCECKISHTKSK